VYVSRSIVTLRSEGDLAPVEAAHASRKGAEGFRWTMLLRPLDGEGECVSLAMWLRPEHDQAWREVNEVPGPMRGYDVTTARGAMTPAAAVALVEWRLGETEAASFANAWNAYYHAIEDVFGSRLLQDLADPSAYTGLHVVTNAERLDTAVLAAELSLSAGLSLAPSSVQRFEVLLLTEA
jgi:hypothetical protein